MKTYKVEIDELVKHLEQVIMLAAGGFKPGDAGEIQRLKAVMHLRALRGKATSLMLAIAEETE